MVFFIYQEKKIVFFYFKFQIFKFKKSGFYVENFKNKKCK